MMRTKRSRIRSVMIRAKSEEQSRSERYCCLRTRTKWSPRFLIRTVAMKRRTAKPGLVMTNERRLDSIGWILS